MLRINVKDEEMLFGELLDVCNANDGLYMDNDQERLQLSMAIVFKLTGKSIDLKKLHRCRVCGDKLEDPNAVECTYCYTMEEYNSQP